MSRVRPASATVFPPSRQPVVVLDSGANVDCSADELTQFARLGAVYAVLRSVGRGSWFAMPPSQAVVPVVIDPPLTMRQVRQQATEMLRGVRVRRLVFWRYLLLWHKPMECPGLVRTTSHDRAR